MMSQYESLCSADMNANSLTIDWKLVDKLLEAGNDGVRIAANLGIHQNTLYDRCVKDCGCGWTDYMAQKRSRGDSLLAAKQYEVAMKGNVSMLIWLGKNRLSQKDKQDIEVLTELASGLNELLSSAAKHGGKIPPSSQSEMEAGEPLLDKECSGTKGKVSTELGSAFNP